MTNQYARTNDLLRLEALDATGILDTPPEQGFDDIVRLASRLCAAPIALVSFVASDRQWFKARINFPDCETDLDRSVCKFVLAEPDLLVIPDLTADARTVANPLVTDDPHIRFYAGVPLRTPEGHVLGSLCVIDTAPRPLGLAAEQADDLRALARQVTELLALRRSAAAERIAQAAAIADAARLEAMIATQQVVASITSDLDTIFEAVVAGALRIIDAATGAVIEMREGDELVYRTAVGTSAVHVGARLPLLGTLSGRALLAEQPHYCPDTETEPMAYHTMARGFGNRSAIVVPVFRQGVAIGVLKVQSDEAEAFAPRDILMAQMLAGLVASGFGEVAETQTRRALHEAESRYKAIFDSATDFAIVAADEKGRITDWNVGAVQIMGWTEEEIRGLSVATFFTPEDREGGVPEREERLALTNGSAIDERWHYRKDGGRFWAIGRMMALCHEDGTARGFLKILQDRTLQRRAEETLRESEERLHLALDAADLGTWDLNLLTDTSTCSPRHDEIFGYSEPPSAWGEEICGRHIVEQDQPIFRAAFAKARENGVLSFEARVRGHDGVLRWIAPLGRTYRNADGHPVRMAGVVADITARKVAEERRAALLDLTDRLHDLDDRAKVSFAAAEVIGQAIYVDRVGYATVSDDSETLTIERDWTSPGFPSAVGLHRMDSYGEALVGLRNGEAIVIEDVTRDPRTCDRASNFEAVATRALINLPLVEGGKLVALFFVNAREPRTWTAEEIAFIRGAAEQTRVAIERRRAEHKLRNLAASLEQQVRARTRELDRAWSLSQELLVVALPDGTIESVNPTWTHLLGWKPREIVGSAFMDYVHPDELDATLAAFVSMTDAPLAVPYEYRFRHRDGSYRWFAWTGTFEAGRIYASGRNVNAEREQAETLRRSERRATTFFNFSDDYLFLVRVEADGVVRFDDMNRACERAMGLARADVIGHPVDAFVPENSADDIKKYARLCLETRHPQTYLAVREYRDGHKAVINGRVAFVERFKDGGGVVLFSGSDVTEQHRIEEALRQAQKMEAVGQLTGGLAHDFNNLLAGISGSLELMQTRMGQGRFGDLDRYMTVAQGASKRAAALTHRLLAFSRRQTLDPKPTTVNRLIAGMEELIRRTIGPQIALEVVGAASLWPTLIDAGQLENALLNLCINARDAMPDGGRIVIETANKWLDRSAAISQDIPEGQYLSVCVTDTGTGMTPEIIAKVFEPFFTTKPIGEGTGLGLSMIYGFAKQSGGQVRIYSEVGHGTTVCLYLPRHYGEADTEDVALKLAEVARSGQGETVLIVDDEPSVRMLVTEVLEDLGYTAIEAADSVAGLKVLHSDVRIDLLVTDVGLPGGMNGRQMADAGRVSRPDLKVLFITGYAENAALGNGHLQPGMHVLTKPFAMEALATRIRGLIAPA